jgi:hypothetical protein
MNREIKNYDPGVRIEDVVYPIEIDTQIKEDIKEFNRKLQDGTLDIEELNFGY